MGFLSSLFKKKDDFEAAKEVREKFLSQSGDQGAESAEVDAACALMLDRKYDEVKPARSLELCPEGSYVKQAKKALA